MLSDNLPMSPRQRRCLDALENAGGRIMSSAGLREVICRPPPADQPRDFDNLLKVTIFEIRRIMAAAKIEREIETVWRRGYRLTSPFAS
jgi:DNA-binding winged helix-turn-helix (wHTH) protein